MNVFFAPFTYGGATIVAEQVAQALVRRTEDVRFKVTAVSLCTRSDLATYTVVKSEIDGICNYVINVPFGRSYRELYDNPNVTKILRELISDIRPNLVHAHCLQDMGVGVLQAAYDLSIPSILSVHDFWWLCERQFMIKPDRSYCGQNPVTIEECKGCVSDFDLAKTRFDHLQLMSRFPARVTYPSQFAHNVGVASGFAPDRSVVWENGVSLPRSDFIEKQTIRREKNPVLTFGFAGGPSQIKGWPIIRAAFEKMPRDDFKVIVIEGSKTGEWWRNRSFEDLPGEWEVHPHFEQVDMDDFYARIDVLLFMSQWKETFGLVLREALARGLSVIQTDSGGTTEHGAVRQDQLIPIGAPPAVLQNRLEDALSRHPDFGAPQSVVDYDMQADQFARLAQDVLENYR